MDLTPPPVRRTSEGAVADFLAAGEEAFAAAVATRGARGREIAIDARPVHLRLAGPALEGWAAPALEHHVGAEHDGGAPLEVRVFDSWSTGTRMPPPPWPKEAYTPTSEVAGLDGERYLAAFNVGTGVLDVLDLEAGRGLHWIADARRHPPFDVSSPFRVLFHWWMRRSGAQLVHAGAVARNGRGVLIAGKGGAGKSTLALACLLAGHDFLGDDYVLVRTSPRVEALSLFRSAKLDVGDLRSRFPALAGAICGFTTPPDRGKAVLMLGEPYGERLCFRTALSAIVLPRVSSRSRAVLREASAEDALRALVPSTCRQLTGVRKGDLDEMARLVRALPAFFLETGPDVAEAPALLERLLDGRDP